MLPRWQRHWWEWTEIETAGEREPTVWVDPSLFVEQPLRTARGTTPPPAVIGAYCTVGRTFGQ